MDIHEQIASLYERYGAPALTNFRVEDITGHGRHEAGVFTLADIHGDVVLIRRKPQADYPDLETFWWLPGGGLEAGERLDEAAVREFREETGLEVHLERLLVALTKPLKGVLIGEGRQHHITRHRPPELRRRGRAKSRRGESTYRLID